MDIATIRARARRWADIEEPVDTTDQTAQRAVRGRRMSWEEFYKLFPDRRPVNDNTGERRDAA